MSEELQKSKRGFASMTPERRKEIASFGGRMSQRSGKGHRYTTEEARSAGRLGGRKVSQDREHMSRIGKIARSRDKKKS